MSIKYMREVPQVRQQKKEVKANTWGNSSTEKRGQTGLFSQPYTSFPRWGLCFWRCTSLWSLFLNLWGHDLLPLLLALTWLILFPGTGSTVGLQLWQPPTSTPVSTHTHTNHANTPPVPPSTLSSPPQHYTQAILLTFHVNMTSCSMA